MDTKSIYHVRNISLKDLYSLGLDGSFANFEIVIDKKNEVNCFNRFFKGLTTLLSIPITSQEIDKIEKEIETARTQKTEELKKDNYIIFSYKDFILYSNRESGEHNCLFLYIDKGKPVYEHARNDYITKYKNVYQPSEDEAYNQYELYRHGKIMQPDRNMRVLYNDAFEDNLKFSSDGNGIEREVFANNYCKIQLLNENILYVFHNKRGNTIGHYVLFSIGENNYFKHIFRASIEDLMDKKTHNKYTTLNLSIYKPYTLLLEKDKIKMFEIASYCFDNLYFLFCKEADNNKIMFFRDIRKEGDSLIISLSCYDEHNRENIVEYK